MPYSILIADDDIDVLQLLAQEVAAMGYRVITAIDGQTAISLTRKEQPDIIVLDVAMPMRTGIDVFDILRKSETTKRIPVIFITEIPSAQIYPIIANASRVAHLKKPIDLDDLGSLLRDFCDKYLQT